MHRTFNSCINSRCSWYTDIFGNSFVLLRILIQVHTHNFWVWETLEKRKVSICQLRYLQSRIFCTQVYCRAASRIISSLAMTSPSLKNRVALLLFPDLLSAPTLFVSQHLTLFLSLCSVCLCWSCVTTACESPGILDN